MASFTFSKYTIMTCMNNAAFSVFFLASELYAFFLARTQIL